MAPLLARLRAHLDRARLFPAPGRAVLAVSGGLDSVALLDLMHSLAPERELALVVAHADHGIQTDSRTVGQAVRDLVQRRGMAFHDDPANRDPGHLRSWLRVTLLPQLATRLGSNLRADVLRLGRAAAVERRAWDRALELVPELRLQCCDAGFDVARAPLSRYDKALSAALLRAAARRGGLGL